MGCHWASRSVQEGDFAMNHSPASEAFTDAPPKTVTGHVPVDPRHRPVPRHQPRRRGVVIILALFGAFLLAALVMYVVNLGGHINRRDMAQHAADAAALAGANHMARTFNLVASHNVATARYLAAVQVLDGLPQSVDLTREDQLALYDRLQTQIPRISATPTQLRQELRDSLEQMADEVAREIEILQQMQAALARFDMDAITHYDAGGSSQGAGPSGSRGQLWQSMIAMHQVSRAAMTHLGPLTQRAAAEMAERNLNDGEGAAAVLLPVEPEVPWMEMDFDEFQRPVTQGLLPEVSDDPVVRRGPWDAVFGWRWLDNSQRYWAGGSFSGNVPIGSGSQGGWVSREPDPDHYRVYGPFASMLYRLATMRLEHMPHSRFAFSHIPANRRSLGQTIYWMNHIATIKLNYLWPQGAGVSPEIVDAEWENNYLVARELAENDPSRIFATRFVIVELKSLYPASDARFLSPGTWAHVSDFDQQSPRVHYASGWVDPETWPVPLVDDFIWRDQWSYPETQDDQIGLTPQYDEDGMIVSQPVYRIDSFIFAGANIGQRITVTNPNNFSGNAELPRPIDLNHDLIDHSEASRQRYLRVMSIVQRSGRPLMWAQRFGHGSPGHRITATCEADLFNDHSWDLFTPMWHAQLKPVEHMDGWIDTMQRDAELAQEAPGMTPTQYDALIDALGSMQPLSDIMLTH